MQHGLLIKKCVFTEEEKSALQPLLRKRERQIEGQNEAVFGVTDPIRFNQKQKKYETFCNEGGCETRTSNFVSHLVNHPSHKYPKERAAMVNSFKVSFSKNSGESFLDSESEKSDFISDPKGKVH